MDTLKQNLTLFILGLLTLLLVALIVWQLRDGVADEAPLTPAPAPTTTSDTMEAKLEEAKKVQEAYVPPTPEERAAQLESLKEKENPYQLSTEERRAQFESLQAR